LNPLRAFSQLLLADDDYDAESGSGNDYDAQSGSGFDEDFFTSGDVTTRGKPQATDDGDRPTGLGQRSIQTSRDVRLMGLAMSVVLLVRVR